MSPGFLQSAASVAFAQCISGPRESGSRYRTPPRYPIHLPFENDLLIKVTRKHKDGVTIQLPLRDELLNTQGVLHGGVAASIADEAAWHAMISHYGDRVATTTELKVNYLRPITGKIVTARAYLLKAGATLCVTRIDLFGSGRKLGAVAVVTYMLLDAPATVTRR